MDVRICGPNLRKQDKGTFHVHADSCKDLFNYGPRRHGSRALGGDVNGEDEMLVTDATIYKVVEAVYDNGILDEAVADELEMRRIKGFETDGEEAITIRTEIIESYISDFWFAPCCSELPRGDDPLGSPSQPLGQDTYADGTPVPDDPTEDIERIEIVTPVYEVWVVNDRDSFMKLGQDELQEKILQRVNSLTVGQTLVISVHRSDEYH